jgi:hypothetical protein
MILKYLPYNIVLPFKDIQIQILDWFVNWPTDGTKVN